jgi:hypothetical protein
MANQLSEIKGLDAANIAKLNQAGIKTADDLLARALDYGQRGALAKELGLATPQHTECVTRADQLRLKAVRTEYANLLEECGVDSTKELRNRVPANLHERLTTVNAEKKIVQRPPALSQVEAWVKEAKTLA